MSQYSEMMGSFIRTGNYPLEANYIFPTEAALKEFYNDSINQTTLHKGLFRIVENGGNGSQALYWVVKKQTNDQLEFVKLIENLDTKNIYSQLDDIRKELEAQAANDTAIWGTTNPETIKDNLNSILDLSLAIADLQEELEEVHKELVDSDDSIKKSLKTQLKATVGTAEDDLVEYLKTLPYQSLTKVAEALDLFLNQTDNSTTKINTLRELQSFLDGYTDSDKLTDVLEALWNRIQGSTLPTEEFRTIRGIEDFVRKLESFVKNRTDNLQTELNQTQIGVGLDSDGSFSPDKQTNYLQDATSVMNALRILDGLVQQALSGHSIRTESLDIVPLVVRREADGYVLGASLKLSNALGNDLIKNEDGLYINIDSEYNNGILTLRINDRIVAQHTLGLSSIVDRGYYDPTTESLIIVFKLDNGDKQTVTIPVGALIREWDIDNSQPGRVVELVREEVVNGPDRLSADVRLVVDRHNILEKQGNALIVRGTSDNITHKDANLSEVIDSLQEGLVEEKRRAEAAEDALLDELAEKADINSPILKGVPMVETSPDPEDSSQRIPSTNWVKERISEIQMESGSAKLEQHLKDLNNPHQVTASQVGTYTSREIENKLDLKADLTNGKVNPAQLPDLSDYWTTL